MKSFRLNPYFEQKQEDMRVNGGKLYWMRKKEDVKNVRGIVLVFGWISIHETHLMKYVDLYASIGWDSLVCYADFLNILHPQKATNVAIAVLNELLQELRTRPCPVVFAAFSGGSKACMYKVFQIIDAKCEGRLNPNDKLLFKSCFSGHIYDSCPSDFINDLGVQFTLHPSLLKIPGASIVPWVAKGIASGLDSLFLTQFESQCIEYWQTLHSSVDMGAPFLILCSESDDLVPCDVICNFAGNLRDLRGDVELVKWSGSPHVGHYKTYPSEYKSAVTNLLEKATSVYSQKIRQLEGEQKGIRGTPDEISDLICNLQKVVVNSNQSLRRVAVSPSDHFYLPSSALYQNGSDSDSSQDEKSVRVLDTPSISAHSVLGQILFDVCVPKNIEGWDVKFSGSVNGQRYPSPRPFQGFNFIRRSKL